MGSSTKQYLRPAGERPRQRNTLLLTSRKLRRIVPAAIAQAYLGKIIASASGRLGDASQLQRHHDILFSSQQRQQLEILKDKTDLSSPQCGPLILIPYR